MSSRNGSAAQDALQFWPQVYALALTLTRDRAWAEDLCQEAYLRLISMKREVDRSRPLRSLLLTIVRNLFISETRRPVHGALQEELLSDPGSLDPSEEASRREEARAVEFALARLKPEWRAALYLRDGLGLAYREIAEVLGRTEDVIRVTLHRARLRVREALMRTVGERSER